MAVAVDTLDGILLPTDLLWVNVVDAKLEADCAETTLPSVESLDPCELVVELDGVMLGKKKKETS